MHDVKQHIVDRHRLASAIRQDDYKHARKLVEALERVTGLDVEFNPRTSRINHPPLSEKTLIMPWSVKVRHSHENLQVTLGITGETYASLTATNGRYSIATAARIILDDKQYGLGDLSDLEEPLLEALVQRGTVSSASIPR